MISKCLIWQGLFKSSIMDMSFQRKGVTLAYLRAIPLGESLEKSLREQKGSKRHF